MYRQNAIPSCLGIDIDRTTLANWMILCGEFIQSLITYF
ncbi:transposase [Arenicella sp. 4NH20-0111]